MFLRAGLLSLSLLLASRLLGLARESVQAAAFGATGLGDVAGSVTPGRQADLVLVRARDDQRRHDRSASATYASHSGSVHGS